MTVSPVGGSALAGFGQSPYTPPGQTGHPGDAATGGRGRRRAPADWHEALTELEGDVLDAQESLARGRADEIAAWGRRSTDWIPPTGLGPVPADLRERAALLLQRQLAVAEALVERITQSQKQRDVAARMSYGDQRPAASFIDRGL
ncbi:hypothetical protein [Blastococcus goldschmidtiae]|uniref:Flagellar protein FliT n=1 Tax=Blastococcus goldschmidtiae TaxID=3075546 RepID=A0ABU2K633_9ACTN|nr:hypothetical protein [Blastococcus sp. DSM 46792]MDT0275639.1 hypothetical protein [Blastococcus sp. DSM 46792]